MREDTITIVIPGECSECGCEVTPDNVGFECDTFETCRSCYDAGVEDCRRVLMGIDGN
jgi:predicted Zn-ribbon and HTH transcriptional regulator